MGSFYFMMGIVAIIGILVILAYDNSPTVLTETRSEARELLASFGKESIAFDLEPQPPSTEYSYIEVIIQKIIETENGTQTVESVELVQIPTSEIYAEIKDRQTGQIKIVKRGHQSDITGTIILVDPVTGLTLVPPYSFFLTLDCDFRNDCNTNPIGINEFTDGEGKFKYTWASKTGDSLGEYKTFVRVTSLVLDSNGNRQVLEHYLNLELIE